MVNIFMKVEIKVEEDENFKLVNATNVEVDVVSDTPSTQQRSKIPAPMNNPKGIGWFDGTSWGAK